MKHYKNSSIIPVNISMCHKLIVIIYVAVMITSHASAANPLLPFQGYLQKPDGQPVEDGAKLVQFKLYDSPIGGSNTWAGEVHKLSVNSGLVNTILGTKVSLLNVKFNNPQYLEITVDADGSQTITPADPPLLPRQVIIPAVFSNGAAQLSDGDVLRSWGDVFNGTILKASSIEESSITLDKIKFSNGGIDGDFIEAGSLDPNRLDPGKFISTINLPQIPDSKLPMIPVSKLPSSAFTQTVFDIALLEQTVERSPNNPFQPKAAVWNKIPFNKLTGSNVEGASEFCKITLGQDGNYQYFELEPGSYYIEGTSNNYLSQWAVTRIVEVGTTNPLISSMSSYSRGPSGDNEYISLKGILSVPGAESRRYSYEVWHYAIGSAAASGTYPGDSSSNPLNPPNNEYGPVPINNLVIIKIN